MTKQISILLRFTFFFVLMGNYIFVNAQTNQFRGVNWADKRDNFQPGVIYLSGLSSTDTYASASIVADRVLSQFVSLIGSNSVRLPINEATVNTAYWNTYKGVIDVALTKGKVVICFWSESSGAQVKDMNAFWSMWQKVVDQYGNNPNMYFEVFNEPSHLNKTDLRTLYFNWLQKFPSFPQNKVILDGSGLAMNVPDIGSDSRFNNCLLAVHEYSFFGSTTSVKESDWEGQLRAFVGNYSNRTVCTEWGGPMGPGTKNGIYYDKIDYSVSPTNFFQAYIRGVSNQLRQWKMGSFYWIGLRDGDWYSLTTRTGEGANIKLSINNQSGLERVWYSWGDYQQVPSVTITQPSSTTFIAPATISINATATSTSGTISKVEFYNGTTKLGEDLTSPYSYTWTNVAKGSYAITAVATDNLGNKATSSSVAIKVNVPQAPYNGTWNLIPGTIQAENYDVGGNGSAYSDASVGNTGGATFRTDEDVDLEVCTDAGAGYNLGYATAGEWLEYSVDVQKLGLYDISFRVAANGDARTLSLSMDDKAIVTNVAIPNTAGWQTWQTVTVKNVTLQPGKQILRLTIGATDYVNLNYVTFTLAKEIKQEPYKGTAHQIPSRIEAEEYDLGGEGLAYHEGNTSGNQGLAILRNDEVDIETTGDVDGAYNVAYILKGEWLEYSVNVSLTRKYDMEFRVAKDGTGGLFHVEIDGVDVTGPITVPNSGGWQVWETIKVSNISLAAGTHIMRIAFDSDYMNFNYVEIKDTITGVEDNQGSMIQLYPNPFTADGLHIDGLENADYKILDLSGDILEKGQVQERKIVGQNLSSGVYFLSLENQNHIKTFKIVKF
jgi:hypothetical protein